MPYLTPTVGPYFSALAGGTMTMTFPSYSGTVLGLLETGVNSTTIPAPTISGWTKVSPNSGAPCSALYARLLLPGDSLAFQWDASHQAYARISAFGGNVYTDLSTIVDVSSDRGTNSTGKIAVASTAVPSFGNGLVIRGGHTNKTATTNGATFNDWLNDTGVYTKVGSTQLVQSGTAMAAALWFWQQTTATGTGSDTAALSIADSTVNTQGFTIILKSAVTAPESILSWPKQTFVQETIIQI